VLVNNKQNKTLYPPLQIIMSKYYSETTFSFSYSDMNIVKIALTFCDLGDILAR